MSAVQVTINTAENGHVVTATDGEVTVLYVAKTEPDLKQIIANITKEYLAQTK